MNNMNNIKRYRRKYIFVSKNTFNEPFNYQLGVYLLECIKVLNTIYLYEQFVVRFKSEIILLVNNIFYLNYNRLRLKVVSIINYCFTL